GINLIGYCFSPIAMFFAMFLTEITNKKYKKFIQTATTLPNFVSWATVYSVAYAMFSVSDGLLNHILLDLGLIEQPINFLTSTKFLWLKMVLWQVWKGTGWSAIIYFAAISGIDQEMYEAAMIDGAGRYKTMWYITLPQLMPTFFVLLILSIGNFLNTGMEQYFIFSNPMTSDKLEVLDLYVYNQGIVKVQYPYTTAVGMLKSIVGIILLFFANKLSKLVRGYGIL
ncbi:MAG: sugar ABC transporter permease, partial [Clostridiales bacterium]|nr:sugar ABC transporter permease [Clostridiales bacterium]